MDIAMIMPHTEKNITPLIANMMEVIAANQLVIRTPHKIVARMITSAWIRTHQIQQQLALNPRMIQLQLQPQQRNQPQLQLLCSFQTMGFVKLVIHRQLVMVNVIGMANTILLIANMMEVIVVNQRAREVRVHFLILNALIRMPVKTVSVHLQQRHPHR
jgi:hypothetical protein